MHSASKKRAQMWVAFTLSGALGACQSAKMPDPKVARDEYLRAAEQGDAVALRAMMTERAARDISDDELEQLLIRDKKEFSERKKALAGDSVTVRGRATLYLAGDRTATLSLNEGEFRVDSVGLVAPAPQTVQEAIVRFRQALLARDFDLLVAAFTDESADELIASLDRLEKSLEDLDTAIFDVRQERATIEFPDGRVILLRRADGVWKVEDVQ